MAHISEHMPRRPATCPPAAQTAHFLKVASDKKGMKVERKCQKTSKKKTKMECVGRRKGEKD